MGPPIEDNSKLPVVDWKSFTLATIQALREWTELQIRALRKWTKVHLRLRDRAVRISIFEIERRLTALNHAHEQAVADKLQFLTHGAFAPWKDSIEKRLTSTELVQAKAEGERARLDAVIERLDRMDALIKEQRDNTIGAAGQRQALAWVPVAVASLVTGIFVAAVAAALRYFGK